MSTTKTKVTHTPGPWKAIDLRHQKNGQIAVQADVSPYSHVANVLARNAEALDNANVIAAAPEMLELIELAARGYCPSCGCDLCNTAGCPSCTWMMAARKLLARLNGTVYAEPPILAADEINKQNSRLGEKK